VSSRWGTWAALEHVLPRTSVCHLYVCDGGSADHPGTHYTRRLEAILLANQRASLVRADDPRIAVWADHNTKPGTRGYAAPDVAV